MKIGTFFRTALLLLSFMSVLSISASTGVQLKHSYTFEDGTANDVIGGLNGTIVGGKIAIADGMCTVTGATAATDGYMTIDAVELALKDYGSITLEAFVKTSAGVNSSYCMMAYFGTNTGGKSCLWIQPARKNTTESRVETSDATGGTGHTVTALTANELDDDGLHHVVAMLSVDSLKYYIDGVKVSSVATGANYITTIGTEIAQLFKGPSNWGDPNYNASIDEFNIYDGEFTDAEIAARSTNFAVVDQKHSYRFDFEAKDMVGTADGTLMGGTVSKGKYVAAANGQYISLPAADIAINTYPAVSIEAYVSAESTGGKNMFAFFGNTVGTVGTDYLFLSSAASKASVSCDNTTQPWTVESNAIGVAINDGVQHHVVGVVSADSLYWYVDGTLASQVKLSGTNSIASLDNTLAYICKGGYTNDATWEGMIEELNIYQGALSKEFIAARTSYEFRAKSTDNTLSSLAVDGGLFDVPFDPATTTYNVTVPTGTTTVSVSANVNDLLATLTGADPVDVSGGSGVATIEVTAEDLSVKTYTVNITVDANFTPAFVITGTVSDYLNSASAFSVPEYASMYWTGDAAAVLSQSPAIDSVITGGGNHVITLMAELNGKVETKFLTVNLISASYWIGAVSTDFYTAANWGGTQSLGNYSSFHIGPIAEGNNECTYLSSNKFSVLTIKEGGKLFVEGNPMYGDNVYMTENDANIIIQKNGQLNIRKDFNFKAGTITILDNGRLDYDSGRARKLNFALDTLTEATLNVFGGVSNFTSNVYFGKGTAHINFKGGGVANFASETVIINADTAGIIKPVDGSLLVHVAGANTVSSIDLPLPAARTEALDANAQFVLPDYFMVYSSGDSAANSTIVYTQTPVAGTVYTADKEVVSVVVEATDFFGNVIKDTIAVTVRTNSNVWRGDFSENYADSANWDLWPLVEYSEIFIDKTFATSFDPVFTSGVQMGELELAPGNTLYINGGECKPNDPVVMAKTSSIIINGGTLNIRENATSTINNGTITLLAHEDGYIWNEFDHKQPINLAPNADDEFTFNAWGGEANLTKITLGAGKVSITLKDDGVANFNDSSMVATAIASGVISAIEGFHLSVNANYTQVRADTLASIEKQVGLVDGNDNYSVPDFTGLAVYAATNPITVTQSPLKDVVINGVGMYTVTLTATDEWGNSSSTDFDLELINYVVDCPAITTLTDADPTDSVVIPDYAAMATTRGLWKENVVISQFPLAGGIVALDSVFEVTITAVDDALQTNFCKFTVTVVDTTIPVIAPLADQILALDGYCTVKIPDYSKVVEVTDVCHKDYVFTQIPAAGTQLIGVGDAAVVNVLVADGNGNVSDTLIFTATAADLTMPVITKAFGNHGLRASANCDAILRDYAALVTATDNCAPALLITQTPDAGTVLAGDGDSVVVTVTIDDQNGNKVDTAWVVKLAAPGCAVKSSVAYITFDKVMDAGATAPENDPIAQLLSADVNLDVTVLKVAADADLGDLSMYDAIVIQEGFGSGSAIFQATGSLALDSIPVPFLYNKTYALRNGKAFTAGGGSSAEVAGVAITVDAANQSNELFNAVTFANNAFNMFKTTAADDGAAGTKALNYTYGLVISDTTTLLGTAVEITDAAHAVFLNDIPAGTTVGDKVTKARMIAVGQNYGAICTANGTNLTQDGLTFWRNAVYSLVGLEVPNTPVIIDAIVNSDASVSSLSVYPSPATTSITIDAAGMGEDVVVSIVDMKGQVVAVYTDITNAISVDGLGAGVYMVKAISSSSIAVTKFVKE